MHPPQGEVWWVSFDPSVGGEIRKTRPAIVLSNNARECRLNRVIVVRSQSNGEALSRRSDVMLNGEQSKRRPTRSQTASKQRLRSKAGSLSSADLAAVGKPVLLQLGIRAKLRDLLRQRPVQRKRPRPRNKGAPATASASK